MSRFWSAVVNVSGLLVLAGVLGVVAYRWLKASDEPAKLVRKWIMTGVVVVALLALARSSAGLGGGGGLVGSFGVAALFVGSLAACGLALAIIWGTSLGAWFARPLTNLFDGGQQEVSPQPMYSIAEAKRKQGKYQEAMAAIQAQLEKFPGDLTGTLLLAAIQVEDLNDLPAAIKTTERLVEGPHRAPGDVALALNQQADWYLAFGQDREAARKALERIIERFPDSEPAFLAAQRLAHLATPEMLEDRQEPHRLKVIAYEPRLGLGVTSAAARPPAEDPVQATANWVKHLEEFPEDNEAREQLAMLYAGHYHRLDLATDQLEQLIAQHRAPARQRVHWLNLLADLQIRYLRDLEAARQTLQRIMRLFPGSAAAENAEKRLAHLKLELRASKESRPIRLGPGGLLDTQSDKSG